MQHMGKAMGFTTVELMVVVIIIAILAFIAVPMYDEFAKRSRRNDAISTLLDIQYRQEKWRADDIDYATLAELDRGSDSDLGFYTISLSTRGNNTYLFLASPALGGPQTGDNCGSFAINQDGPLYTGYAGAECWGR